ncbi:MAG: glycosyl hydrolase [Ignavibacteria bacterium]|nr:glycosyl hydrolase [Ignavibacteria bacterium]
MLRTDPAIEPGNLLPKINRLFERSAEKIISLQETWDPQKGAPVFTAKGVYTSRGWTEWTQGFQFGSALLQFDATGDNQFLDIGRQGTLAHMATHVSHTGVHDHGFNNISTFGNLHRLMREGKTPYNEWEKNFYELALKVSGAVQAARWTDLGGDQGYIYSFNGPHSLFADTVRSLRSLAVAHQLGHVLMGERDQRINLLQRLLQHAETTARYNVYYGEGRDAYDVRGRVAHESIFNLNDGSYRCPSTQQGYSPFSTWTRGLGWILCGYAEELEFLDALPESELESFGGKQKICTAFRDVAEAVADFYIANSPSDGIPYWDTGAPGLVKLGNYLDRPADPFNQFEPVDSSAAVIAAQGLLRLGSYLRSHRAEERGGAYFQAGLTIASHVFDEPYLSNSPHHQGLILHSIYHRPNGWDYVPPGSATPFGESSMWGDYHARELALMIQRAAAKEPYYCFYLQ